MLTGQGRGKVEGEAPAVSSLGIFSLCSVAGNSVLTSLPLKVRFPDQRQHHLELVRNVHSQVLPRPTESFSAF
jgi:hypothetical protein